MTDSLDHLVSADTILSFLKESVEQRKPLPPSTWVDAAEKLNVLLEDETDKLYELQKAVASLKVGFIKSDMSVAEAKTRVEATDEWVGMKKQEAKCKRIEEQIRIAKIQARMRDNQFTR
jgi:hypothetical protein